jgi:cell division septation protein DedD
MITIRPSTVTDQASLPPEVAENAEEQHKARIHLLWIPATLSIGLLIAAVYLGTRILAARAHPKPAVVQIVVPIPAKAIPKPEIKTEIKEATPPPTEPQAAAAPKTDAPRPEQQFVGPKLPQVVTPVDGIPMITPHVGERYIQVGALNAEATRRFIQRLRKENLEPHVAPGPKPELLRVLIGPFDNQDALNERKAQLQTEGIDTFVRKY